MGRVRRSRTHKDLDQIHKELKELDEQMEPNQELDPDLPGFGKYPCEVPYTQAEAEAAVGYSTENSRIKIMEDVNY
ncbi:11258_t:CDS:2 [Racocetra fulgida]|uniref:11258_t:CDS:1 n=1 Tax=Racocetra fulgida TaxID=60492 RepID=A0A9N9GCU5_9GLOM|nr:11258_t:CDS:2 [Racocetra fulgida]